MTVGVATSAGVALLVGSAHAQVSMFTGTSNTTCTRPPAPGIGTSTGNGTCKTTAVDTLCQTIVNAPDATVASACSGDLTADTSLFFIQVRAAEQTPVEVFCLGSGTGTFTYRPTPSSPTQEIPVTVTVQGRTATFSGVSALGVSVAIVNGTFTNACGGAGSYAGQVL